MPNYIIKPDQNVNEYVLCGPVDDLDEARAYVEELSHRRNLQYRMVARRVSPRWEVTDE